MAAEPEADAFWPYSGYNTLGYNNLGYNAYNTLGYNGLYNSVYRPAYTGYSGIYNRLYKRDADADADADAYMPYFAANQYMTPYGVPQVASPYFANTYAVPRVATPVVAAAGQPVFKSGTFHTNLQNVQQGVHTQYTAGQVGQVYQPVYHTLAKRDADAEADADAFLPYYAANNVFGYRNVYNGYNAFGLNRAAYTTPYTTAAYTGYTGYPGYAYGRYF